MRRHGLALAALLLVGVATSACGQTPSKAEAPNQVAGNAAFSCAGMDSRDVLAAIKAQGADLSQPREAVFYFYGAEDKLPALQRGLRAQGFVVRPTKAEPGRVATVVAVTDEAWLRNVMPKLCSLAASSGVTYDGWEASIATR